MWSCGVARGGVGVGWQAALAAMVVLGVCVGGEESESESRSCGRRGAFAGGREPYRLWCVGSREPKRLRANCVRPELRAAQEAWLSSLGGGRESEARRPARAGLRAYFERVYGGSFFRALPDASRVGFFWDSVPGREAFAVQWSCYQCPRYGYLAPGRLWAPVEESKVNPGLLSEPLRAECTRGKPCNAKKMWQELERTYDEPKLRFPGFFAHRFDPAALAAHFVHGIRDNVFVEVLRVARLETKRLPTEVCTRGQVWFWHAPGSGVWLDLGTSLRLNATDGVHAESCAAAWEMGYDTIQLTQSFYGYSYEILDCRGQKRPRSREVWTSACPPDHVPLKWGLPSNRFAPHLEPAAEASDSWGGPCRCDAARDSINCLASESEPGAPPTNATPCALP